MVTVSFGFFKVIKTSIIYRMMNGLEDRLKKMIEDVRVESSEENALLKLKIESLEGQILTINKENGEKKKKEKPKSPTGLSVSI